MTTPESKLRELQWNWNQLGEEDPFWAVLTLPDKKGGKWDPEDFFSRGRIGIEHIYQLLENTNSVPRGGRALDFGCGLGRLTQALAPRFREVVGVDISESMIERAREFAAKVPNVRFEVNAAPDLGRFERGAFDFVLSIIVLQHIPESLIAGYLRELLRVTADGGTLVFQLPSPPEGAVDTAPSRRMRIEPIEPPAELRAGETRRLRLRILNIGSDSWTNVALGNHWRRTDGRVVRWDDARSPLPSPVPSGAAVELELEPTAPDLPGSYRLELDLLQEGAAWFGSLGAETVALDVHVSGPARLGNHLRRTLTRLARGIGSRLRKSPGSVGAPAAPGHRGRREARMEMNGLPRQEIAALVAGGGGEILTAVEDGWGGPGWDSFTYVVRKRV